MARTRFGGDRGGRNGGRGRGRGFGRGGRRGGGRGGNTEGNEGPEIIQPQNQANPELVAMITQVVTAVLAQRENNATGVPTGNVVEPVIVNAEQDGEGAGTGLQFGDVPRRRRGVAYRQGCTYKDFKN